MCSVRGKRKMQQNYAFSLSDMQVHNVTAITVCICSSFVLVKWKIDDLLALCLQCCCLGQCKTKQYFLVLFGKTVVLFHHLQTMMISYLLQKDAIAKTNLQPCMKLMTSPFWTDVQTDAGEKVKGVCAKPDGREYYPGPAKKRFSPSI